MLGSLVVVFSTPFEGGALSLTHEGHCGVIDFAKMLGSRPGDQEEKKDGTTASNTNSDTKKTRTKVKPKFESESEQEPQVKIAYAAFYNNVEHEILPVTSGYRVSITYNLYYTRSDEPTFQEDYFMARRAGLIPRQISAPAPAASYEIAYDKLRSTMVTLLADPSFLPKGGLLGFELKHQYTTQSFIAAYIELEQLEGKALPEGYLTSPGTLRKLIPDLKGSDAVLHNVFTDLKITNLLRFVYEYESTLVMSDYGFKFWPDTCYGDDEEDLNIRLQGSGARLIEGTRPGTTDSDGREITAQEGNFTWVRRKIKKDRKNGEEGGTSLASPYVYGTEWLEVEPELELRLGTAYGDVSLIVWVGPPGEREKLELEVK